MIMACERFVHRDARAVVALVFFASLAMSPARAAPAVTLVPRIGPPTTTINVNGSGFTANAAIDIYFDTGDVCLSLANGTGAFTCTIKAPASAQPQAHWISAVQRNTGNGAQAAFTVRTDWAQFHGLNAKHNGYNPYENTINSTNVRNLDILWSAPVGADGTQSTPVVVGGRVYVAGTSFATNDYKLYAFSNKTGVPLAGWPRPLGYVSADSPAVGNNIVYIATTAPDGKLYAFNATTGVPVAGFPQPIGNLSNVIFSSPTLYAGNVYIAADDGKIYAFNAANGATVPGFPVAIGSSTYADATVSAAGGRIFEGGYDNNLHAYDAVSGTPIGSFAAAAGSIIENVAISSGQLFFGSGDFKIYGVKSRNGAGLSGYPVVTGGKVGSTPAVGDGQVLVLSQDSKLYAISAAGSVKSATLPDSVSVGSPVLANGVIYVNTFNTLYALDESTLSIRWHGAFDTFNFASPTVADGIVYIGSSDGNLYALSVNGVLPSSLLPGGEKGIRPRLSALKPDYSLKLRN
jgi:outer membrane protein assembly factor BamB